LAFTNFILAFPAGDFTVKCNDSAHAVIGGPMQIETIIDPVELIRRLGESEYHDIGQYVERNTVGILDSFVPPAYLYPNPLVKDPTSGALIELADALFWFGSTMLLLECKGRQVRTLEDFKNEQQRDVWLNKRLRKAKNQLARAQTYLDAKEGMVASLRDTVVLVDFGDVQQIIPVVIVFEPSDFFWRPVVHERKEKYPDIQIWDLRALLLVSKYLPDPADFCEYFAEKQRVLSHFPEFLTYEEILLLFFLSHGKSFEDLCRASSTRDINRILSYGLPRGITPSHLRNAPAEQLNDLFSVISAIGLDEWDKVWQKVKKNQNCTYRDRDVIGIGTYRDRDGIGIGTFLDKLICRLNLGRTVGRLSNQYFKERHHTSICPPVPYVPHTSPV
jgi:hypothetical protein